MELSDIVYASTLLFFIFDPFASLPIFISLTKNFSEEDKIRSANKAVLVAGILFVVFVLVGRELLSFFGVTTSGFRIAGGLVLLLMSLEIIFGVNLTRTSDQNVAWVIIATPILTGPGVITTAIILTTNYGYLVPLIGGLFALAITWILLHNAVIITRLVGNNVIEITSKIIGLLIAAIGIEYIMRGSYEFISGLMRLGIF
ncbi:MAG: MarC family protein [Methanomassiliicoccales archaeon]|jgi:multiple antibiotic resistance protein|nr:MarC family protein [Methanomassiliicoccales archaeon]